MKRTRSRKRRSSTYQDPGTAATARTLEQVGGLADTLKRILEGQMGDLVGKVLLLEEALEMNFWVQLRLVQEGVLIPGGDPEEIMNRGQELQREYLATISVARFLEELGYSGVPEEPERPT